MTLRRRHRPLHRRRRRGAARFLAGLLWPVLLPFHLLAVVFAIGWDDVVNIFGGAVDIAQRVRDIVQEAIGVVWNWVSRSFDWVTNWLNTLQAWTGWATNWFTQRIDGAIDWLSRLDSFAFMTLPAWISQSFADAVNFARSLFASVEGLVSGILNEALAAVDHLMQWTITYVFNVLADLLNNTVNRLNDWISWLPNRIAEVLAWTEQRIWDIVNFVVGPIRDVWQFVTDDLLPLWRRVVGWLEFLANHPFDWFTQLLRSYIDKGSRQLVQMLLDAGTRNMDVVEETVAQWLAS